MNEFQDNYQKTIRESKKKKWENHFEFQLRYENLPRPEREYKFHNSRKWKIDFAWPALRIAVEIEGGIWIPGGGGHSHPIHIERDIEKYNQLSFYGFRLFRFTDKEIKNGLAIRLIRDVFKQNKINNALCGAAKQDSPENTELFPVG